MHAYAHIFMDRCWSLESWLGKYIQTTVHTAVTKMRNGARKEPGDIAVVNIVVSNTTIAGRE